QLASNNRAAPSVLAVATAKLEEWRDALRESAQGLPMADVAHRRFAAQSIERFLNRPAGAADPPDSLSAPPGSPIGSTDRHNQGH
ncbi:MAG TPA: hypothetical protein VLV83_15705, partial [Acidobacteriota bacterium]|nr:hypothetical protein [Acidobacteriota bacterium]